MGTTYGVIDNLAYTHGRHTYKDGIEIRRVRLNQGKTVNNTLTFGGNDDNCDQPERQDHRSTNCFYCALVLPYLRRTFYMPYFQDEWKVTPTLTVNLGLRYEYYGVAE